MEPERVLSIQSHVVSGYVGNRAATFPLQYLGYDVDVINTVQYSNHTGYGFTDGYKTTPEQLLAIFNGLTVNGLARHSRVLTGYIPGAEALTVVAEQLSKLKAADPNLIYVLDPVMGDIGTGLYVSESVVPIYKSMLPLATVITPNQFEVELLSGISISSFDTLHSALQHLHKEVRHVAFSSIPLPSSLVARLALPAPPPIYERLLPGQPLPWYHPVSVDSAEEDTLVCFASTAVEGEMSTWAFALPTVQGYFSGVGDLFSAMVLAHYHAGSLFHAVSRALLVVQQILLRTHLHSIARPDATSGTATPRPLHHPSLPTDSELDTKPPTDVRDPRRKAQRMRLRELRVVPERELLNIPEGWPGKQLDWNDLLHRDQKTL